MFSITKNRVASIAQLARASDCYMMVNLNHQNDNNISGGRKFEPSWERIFVHVFFDLSPGLIQLHC